MDKDTLETILDSIRDEQLQLKAMMMEILQWKSEIEEALTNVQSGGFLSIMGKMLAK